MNQGWKFTPEFTPPRDSRSELPELNTEAWQNICLPHSVRELPYNGFDERDTQLFSAYWRIIEVPPEAAGRRTLLHFEGVMLSCVIRVNGGYAGEHAGGYTPFDIDISSHCTPGQSCEVLVTVDSRENQNIPPFGNVVDFLAFGGIYRDVELHIREKRAVSELRIVEQNLRLQQTSGSDALPSLSGDGEFEILTGISSLSQDERLPDIGLLLELEENGRISHSRRIELNRSMMVPDESNNSMTAFRFPIALENLQLWDPDRPFLYDLKVRLLVPGGGDSELIHEPDPETDYGGSPETNYAASPETEQAHTRDEADVFRFTTGFRHIDYRPDGFYLNGRKFTIIGLNRHQSFPYAGYAMPARAQRRDADILKYELAVNLVRTSHYPQSRHFLRRCNEIGLLVMEEIPGWQYIGDEEWKKQSLQETGEMIRAHAHHPSIIMWGVRINESPDDDNFYSLTNALAARLDATRPRGGVRNFAGSRLFENVYTFNEFNHDGRERPIRPRKNIAKKKVPFLVTEHNGHMYPTKRFDQEERLIEHALRHARVMNAAVLQKDVTGAIGWCAFDYNTHKEFGSGDRICYHGVMDMFRIPKFAAHLYKSQQDPRGPAAGNGGGETEGRAVAGDGSGPPAPGQKVTGRAVTALAGMDRAVMEPLTHFALGERDGARSFPIYVATNCQSIRVERNGEFVGEFFPCREEFPGLAHPPVKIPELVGNRLDGYGFSQRQIRRLKRILAIILEKGTPGLSPGHWISMGLIFLRRGINFVEAERIFNRAATGWGEPHQQYRFTGMIHGEAAIEAEYGDAVPRKLKVHSDDTRLSGGEWDCTRIVCRLEDRFGNVTPYVNDYVQFSVEGPGRVIGPEQTAFIGGAIAVWVRSRGTPGTIRFRAECGRFSSETLEISVE